MNFVRLTVNYSVSKEQVWNAWVVPSLIKKWFGSDPAGIVLSAEVDVRPGGKYSITFQDHNGTEHTCSGVYSTVIPYDALAFSWEWQSEPSHFSQVKIQLITASPNVTTMQFEHKDLNPESLHGYEEGWRSTFQKLGASLAQFSGNDLKPSNT